MADANLLVSYDPGHDITAKTSIENALKEIKETFKFLKAPVEGLFYVSVNNPKKTVKALGKLFGKKPELFSYTYHWTPVDVWCASSIPAMQTAIKKLQAGIKSTESWKMELSKRNYDKGKTTELILRLTDVVDKPKVDLQNPEKIIKVEIVGSKAGISLLEPEELLSTVSDE